MRTPAFALVVGTLLATLMPAAVAQSRKQPVAQVEVSKGATSLPGPTYAWVPMPARLEAELDQRAQDPAFRTRLQASLDKALQAKGYRRLLGAEEAAHELGITSAVPLLGYVFRDSWAEEHGEDVHGLVQASRAAKKLLAESDDEWNRLRPLMRAGDDATFRALRDGFRAGIPSRWGEAERTDAARLFAVMAELGGKELVGDSAALQPGTFWPGTVY